MAVSYDINADQGATLHLTFRWRHPRTAAQIDTGEPGTPVDLTGFAARMHARTDISADVVSLELTTENARIILGASDPTATPDLTSGLVTLWVEAAATTAIAAGTYYYDLEMVSGTGFVTRLIQGKLKLSAEVTR